MTLLGYFPTGTTPNRWCAVQRKTKETGGPGSAAYSDRVGFVWADGNLSDIVFSAISLYVQCFKRTQYLTRDLERSS